MADMDINEERIRRQIARTLFEALGAMSSDTFALNGRQSVDIENTVHFLSEKVALARTIALEQEPMVLLKSLIDIAESREVELLRSRRAKPPEYKTGSFGCKSDLDTCLQNANDMLEQALCWALFIRCIIKE
jgi:hypothetical protein